jgi:hypothetical protein
MTDRIALALALLIAIGVSLDFYMEWGATFFLLKKFYEFLDWVMFWR